jgi:hypothetical protein
MAFIRHFLVSFFFASLFEANPALDDQTASACRISPEKIGQMADCRGTASAIAAESALPMMTCWWAGSAPLLTSLIPRPGFEASQY